MSDHADLCAFAQELADAARGVCLSYFRAGVAVATKSDESPVTQADRETEQHLRQLIAARDPEAGVIGEEGGSTRADAETVWVLDPLDGTKSFISGFPLFGTLIAAVRGGRPVVGVIDMPALDERWIGEVGRPTRYLCGGRSSAVATRACGRLADAVISVTSIDMFAAEADRAAFERLSRRTRMRRFGGDCYQYGRLAAGDLDLVVEASLQPYDYMALVPVLEGAGGTVSDWAGRALGLDSDGRVLAAGSPDLHRQALAELGPA